MSPAVLEYEPMRIVKPSRDLKEPVKIGFTGSSKRITEKQKKFIEDYLRDMLGRAAVAPLQFHHGDCVVADEFAHNAAYRLGYHIVVHPPGNPKKRAYVVGFEEIRKPLPYLERNRNIVTETDILLAAPDGPERQRSGTWSTIRRAREQNKPIVMARWDL